MKALVYHGPMDVQIDAKQTPANHGWPEEDVGYLFYIKGAKKIRYIITMLEKSENDLK